MDHTQVQLIGVFSAEGDPDPKEGFVYSTNAPTNLWIGAICDDGSRMGHQIMAHILNGILRNDEFIEGGVYALRSQSVDGPVLLAEVGDVRPG